jgi:hypothetical protein
MMEEALDSSRSMASIGLPFKTGVEQLIASHAREWIILRSGPCVMKKRRPFSTFLLNVFSQDRMGLASCRHWRFEEQQHARMNAHLSTGEPKLSLGLRRAEKESKFFNHINILADLKTSQS